MMKTAGWKWLDSKCYWRSRQNHFVFTLQKF